jgi:hypothetical protein
LPIGRKVIAEGFRLLPGLVKPLLENRNQSVWLLPTREFRRAAFENRGTLWDIAGKTSDPERALHNLLVRDELFTDRLRKDVQKVDLPAIEIDSSMTKDALVSRVANQFGF